MTGAAMTYQATGDAELKRRLIYVIDELAEVQKAHGDGYALATKGGRRAFAQVAAGDIRIRVRNDRVATGGVVNGCFDLAYVLNKILLGVDAIHRATGYEKAARVFYSLSDWFGTQVADKLDDARLQRFLIGEHGSLAETYASAYTRTGDEKYRRWAQRLVHHKATDPLAAGDVGWLVGQHCNAHIPKFTVAERVSRVTGDAALHRAAANAWRAYAIDYAHANGGNGCDEYLMALTDFERHLPHKAGPESCATVNMLRLTEALFEVEPTADKMDYYERALFDHTLSTHDPILGRAVYHTPPRHATARTYSHEFNSMWCCTGTGFEAPGKYAQMIFSRAADDSAVRVNLFAPATLEWRTRCARLRQETAFPYGETSCVKVEKVGADAKFAVRIRRPAWAGSGFAVYVNGARHSCPAAGYITIDREWKAGDRIDVEFPMTLRAELLPGSKRYCAFFYGPTLLVGDFGTEGIRRKDYIADPEHCVNVPNYCSTMYLEPPIPEPSLPSSALRDPASVLEPTACGPLTFRLKGTDILLVPMFALHFSRYTMYWRMMDEDENRRFAEAQSKAAAYSAKAADSVVPEDEWSEKRHGLSGAHTDSGVNIYGGPDTFGWRGAHGAAGGHFAYRLATGDGPCTLVARYRMCEKGPRKFDVQVDGRTIFTEDLKDSGRRGFFFREMKIPPELTAGKKKVEVRFVPYPGNIAGGLFGLWLLDGGR